MHPRIHEEAMNGVIQIVIVHLGLLSVALGTVEAKSFSVFVFGFVSAIIFI